MVRIKSSMSMSRIIVCAFLCLLFAVSQVSAQNRVEVENEGLANWHINYASYLIDVGKYLEALENYDSAYELSARPKTKANALMGKAMALASFLDAPDKAIALYQRIGKEFPAYADIAVFRQGLLYSDMGDTVRAGETLRKYLALHPDGRFRFQAEALLQALKEPGPRLPPPGTVMEAAMPVMRVRLCSRAASITIEAASGKQICVEGVGCSGSFQLAASGNSVAVHGQKIGQIRIQGDAPMTVICGKKKKTVRGELRVTSGTNGLLAVNFVDIENYLRAVVPAESYASWPAETLKAQAVAARTYAYYQKLHRTKRPYDVVDDEGDQVYAGVIRERATTDKAVAATRGQVMVQDARPILAMYTANSGGYTAEAAVVFDMFKPYLIAHPDPESLKGKMATWTKTFSRTDIEYKLNRIGVREKGLRGIQAVQTGPSGRVVKVRLSFDTGARVFRTRTTLRRALNLPDILFEVQAQGDGYVFNGRGYGHGVGYSQWGGAFLGKWKKYDGILRFYYPGADLVRRWN